MNLIKKILFNKQANSSVTVLMIILVICILFISTSYVTKVSIIRTEKAITRIQTQKDIDVLVKETIKQFTEDTTPEAHSYQDPVWTFINTDHHPYSLKLEDISSRLNINWLRTDLFEKTELNRLIVSGEHPDIIRNKRRTMGFTQDLSIWSESFGEENLNRFFTIYSLANINVTFEESLVEIYKSRYGDSGSQLFHSKIQQGLQQFKLWKDEDFPALLGFAHEDVLPVITSIPQMNIHFIDAFLLKCLLSYPYREDPINNGLLKAQQILDIRDNTEITPSRVKSIIAPLETQLTVLEYLGTQTTFWKLTISKGSESFEFIIYNNGVDFGCL